MSAVQRLKSVYLIGILCSFLTLSACGGGDGSSGEFGISNGQQANLNPTGQNFVTVNISQSTGLPNSPEFRTNMVIQDASTWSTVWIRHQTNQSPQQVLPNVDFNQSQIIGIARNSSNGCVKPFIKNILYFNDKIRVEVEHPVPADDQFCTQEHSMVVQFVATERSNLPVEFVDLKAEFSS